MGRGKDHLRARELPNITWDEATSVDGPIGLIVLSRLPKVMDMKTSFITTMAPHYVHSRRFSMCRHSPMTLLIRAT